MENREALDSKCKILLDFFNEGLSKISKTETFFGEIYPKEMTDDIKGVLRKIYSHNFGKDAADVSFSEDEVKILEYFFVNIKNDEIRAKIAYYLFLKNKHNKWAKFAIKYYVISGKNFIENNYSEASVDHFYQRFERSISIAQSGRIQIDKTFSFLKDLLSGDLKKNDYLICSTLKLLKLTRDNHDFCAKFIKENLNKISDFNEKIRIIDIAIEVSPEAEKQSIKFKKANFLLEEAKKEFEGENYLPAQGLAKEAIKSLQGAKNLINLMKECEEFLTKCNLAIQKSAKPIFTEYDKSEKDGLNKNSDEFLSEVRVASEISLEEAIKKFASASLLTKKEKSNCAESLFLKHCSWGAIDDGKEIPDSKKNRNLSDTARFFEYYFDFSGIYKAAKFITDNFTKKEIDDEIKKIIDSFNAGNKRRQFFIAVKGGFDFIRNGVLENLIISSYLIPAQIESILRDCLQRKLKTNYKDATQEDLLMGKMLNDDNKKELEGLFGADFVYNLELILNNTAGFNLRNKIYHGFPCRGDESFSSKENIYLWWLFLKILIIYKEREAKLPTTPQP